MDLKRVREIFFYYLKHPLALSGFLVFGSTFAGNIFAYFFNTFSFRFLGPADYGAFAAVMAVIAVTSIFSQALSTGIVKFVSDFKGRGELDSVGVVWRGFSQTFFLAGLTVFLIFTIAREPLSHFLNLSFPTALIWVGLYLWFSFLQTVNLGTLTGLQNFNFMAAAGFLGSFLKFVLGGLLILLGGRVNGAVLGVSLSVLFVYLITVLPLRGFSLRGPSPNSTFWRRFLRYSFPAVFSLWGIASLANSDVVLVKKFFDAESAGIYAFAALVGRVVLFASSSVAMMMFPIVSERAAGGRRYQHLLYGVFSLTLLISLFINGIYLWLPHLVVQIFSAFSPSAFAASPYIIFLGVYYLLYSLCNVLVNYYLSLHQTLVASVLPLAAALLQIVLISSFHQSFMTVIFSSLITVSLLLLSLLLYFFFNGRRSR